MHKTRVQPDNGLVSLVKKWYDQETKVLKITDEEQLAADRRDIRILEQAVDDVYLPQAVREAMARRIRELRDRVDWRCTGNLEDERNDDDQ
jgi:hypothetical protein